jgi:hypothetical protein
MSNRRLVYCFHLICVFCLNGLLLSAQHSDSSLLIPEKREAWVQSALIQLQYFKADTTIRGLQLEEISFEDYFRLKVRVIGTGLLDLPGKNRIYILTSSSHDLPEVGDISLAMDRHGRIYQNNGHVCGGIITFETEKIKKVKNSREFFRYFVSDTDGEGWKRID